MIAVVRGYITNLRVNVRRLSTGHQIARRRDNFGHRLVNKSLVIAGSAHRDRPINPVNLLDRDRKHASNEPPTQTAQRRNPHSV